MVHRPLSDGAPTYIQQNQNEPQRERGFWGWCRRCIRLWYRFTAPPMPTIEATFEQRERARRGRLASTIMFALLFILVVLVGPIGILGPNHQILFVALGISVLIAICAPLNHRGYVNTVGLIISLAVNLGIYSSILRSPGGIAPDTIAIFDMLVFSEVFVASLLPVYWVIPDAIANMLFSYLVLTYWPKTPLLAQVMHGGGYFSVVSRPIQIHLIVSVVLFLWVRSATQAIQRADRAEEIAKLQHDIAMQEHTIVEEKRQLDASIQAIIATHMEVSKGNLSARVPLVEGAALWEVAGSLNNLLARLQRLQHTEVELRQVAPRLQRAAQVEYELQRTQAAIMQLSNEIKRSENTLKPVQSLNSGTSVDALSLDLLGKYVLTLPTALREPMLGVLAQERARHQSQAQSSQF